MKTLNITFEDNEYNDLIKAKGGEPSWRSFMLKLIKKGDKYVLEKKERNMDRSGNDQNP